MATGVETKVTLSPGPAQVPCLSREQAEQVARELLAAAVRAGRA
jgi:hypothetical protein